MSSGVNGGAQIAIRAARPQDAALVFTLVRELAEYEKLAGEVDTDEAAIAAALFAPEPRLFCDIAEHDGQAAGLAMWFLNFSTFRGRHGIYLEDIFVRPAFRGKGVGTALMTRLAQHCVARGYGRMEWTVLDWNAPSIGFYRSIGALVMDEWKLCRLTGDALARFAQTGTPARTST